MLSHLGVPSGPVLSIRSRADPVSFYTPLLEEVCERLPSVLAPIICGDFNTDSESGEVGMQDFY